MLSKSQNYSKYYWNKVISDYCNLETQWSQVTTLDKSPFRFEDNIIEKERSVLFWQFSKKDIWKLHIIGLMKC